MELWSEKIIFFVEQPIFTGEGKIFRIEINDWNNLIFSWIQAN